MSKTVVILGAGYAGVRCALSLHSLGREGEVKPVLLNKHNYHQFLTQLHEPAAGHVDYDDVRIPLTDIFTPDNHVELVKAEITRIDPHRQFVEISGQDAPPERKKSYDYLVVAVGSEPEFFDIPGLAENSLTLRSLNSARLIRTHIENMFARYKLEPQDESYLTVTIGGAGFTGIELAGELSETLPGLAKKYDCPVEKVKIINIEAAQSILQGFDEDLVLEATKSLTQRGVTLITGAAITQVTPQKVFLADGRELVTRSFIWTGGVRANRLIAEAGFKTTSRGQGIVNKFLQAVGFPEVYLLGDCALMRNPATGEIMGPTAQVAIQGGHQAAKNILLSIRGEPLQVFYPRELGRVASLGKDIAVGHIMQKYKPKGRLGGMVKDLIKVKYLFSLGGISMLKKYLRKVNAF